jgi:hypothetical protein
MDSAYARAQIPLFRTGQGQNSYRRAKGNGRKGKKERKENERVSMREKREEEKRETVAFQVPSIAD